MEAALPLVRRTDNHVRSWLAASLAGTVASLVIGPVMIANDLMAVMPLVVLAVLTSPILAIYIGPFWLVGVGAIAVPAWIALQRFERDTVSAGICLGALTAGACWAAGSYVLSQSYQDANEVLAAFKGFGGGAVAGGVAGWVGWRFSLRSVAEHQP